MIQRGRRASYGCLRSLGRRFRVNMRLRIGYRSWQKRQRCYQGRFEGLRRTGKQIRWIVAQLPTAVRCRNRAL